MCCCSASSLADVLSVIGLRIVSTLIQVEQCGGRVKGQSSFTQASELFVRSSGGCGERFVTAGASFAHGIQRFCVGHQRRRLAVAQSATAGESQCDRRGRHVIRHLCNQDGVMLAEGKVGIFDFATELFNGSADGFKAVMRVGNEPRESVRSVTDLMKKERHEEPPKHSDGALSSVTIHPCGCSGSCFSASTDRTLY